MPPIALAVPREESEAQIETEEIEATIEVLLYSKPEEAPGLPIIAGEQLTDATSMQP